MRSLSSLTIIMLATVTLGAAAGYAQTTPPSNCGIETWSSDKMTYVTVPCASVRGRRAAAWRLGQPRRWPMSARPARTGSLTRIPAAPASAVR
jgi:hypothetical protein